jgi:hypothetical protein
MCTSRNSLEPLLGNGALRLVKREVRVEAGFGLIQADRAVSDEDMDRVIRACRRAGRAGSGRAVIAVDTSVLVRLLVDEPSQPAQVRAARSLPLKPGRFTMQAPSVARESVPDRPGAARRSN